MKPHSLQICNVNRNDMESWYKLKVQEIQTQSNRQNLEQNYAKEEVKRLRVQLTDLRGKLADLEGRVRPMIFVSAIFFAKYFIILYSLKFRFQHRISDVVKLISFFFRIPYWRSRRRSSTISWRMTSARMRQL